MPTCLIVDDSRVIRNVARRILENLDFEIAEASDGMEALTWCRAAMPDAVLLDWNMPVMNSIGFLRQLRKEPGGDVSKVVFCTVETGIENIRTALEAGAAKTRAPEGLAPRLAPDGPLVLGA